MRKVICIVLLSCFPLIASAQNNSLDELKNGIEILEKYKQGFVWTSLVEEVFIGNNLKIDFDLKNKREANLKLMNLYEQIINYYPTSDFFSDALFLMQN